MSLVPDPLVCALSAAGGTAVHALKNSGADRLVFKVKSSNNTEYRIDPVFGFIDAGAKATIKIIRSSGAAKKDKLVIHFAPVAPDAADAPIAFEASTTSGNVTIPLTAV